MKLFLYIVLGLLIVLVAALFLVTTNTKWLVGSANYVQEVVNIEADELTLDLFASRLSGQNIQVDGDFGTVTTDDLVADFSFNDWSNGDPFWSVEAQGINPTLAPQPQPQPHEEASEESEPTAIPLNFRHIDIKDLAFEDQTWSIRADNLGENTLRLNVKEAEDFVAASGDIQISDSFDALSYSLTDLKIATAAMVLTASDAKGDVSLSPMDLSGSIDQLTVQLLEQAEQTEPEAGPLFNDSPLPPLPLLGQPMRLEHGIGTLNIADATLNDVKILASGSDGSFVLQQLSAQTADGTFVASGDIQQVEDRLKTSINIDSDGITLADLGIKEGDIISGGSTALRINLTTTGRTSAEMAAGLNGKSTVALTNAVMQEGAINGIGSDLVLEMMNKLNPFRTEEPTTLVECALLELVAEDGVLTAKNGLVFETDKMKIVGDGRVNLPTEALDVTISPSAREGIGINLGSLVKFVKLGGTLQDPTPEIGALGILQSGAALTAAVSTGGLSVVAEGLAKRAINTGSACEQIAAD